MKLPKKINICGIEHKVITTKERFAGEWDREKRTIKIGTGIEGDILENFLHEVIEAITSIRDLRYALEKEETSNEDYRFSFNHKEFEQMVKDVAAALKGLKL